MTPDEAPRNFTDEDLRKHKEECEKEVDLCHETINKDQGDYDKQLLTLASGFLALVVAFVKDIVPLATADYLSFFYGTLIAFILCILFVLFSYQFSIAGHYKAKGFWEAKKCGEDNSKFPFGYASRVRIANIVSGLLFFAGVIFLVIFLILNVVKERSMTEHDNSSIIEVLQKGSNLKMPSPQPSQGGIEQGSNLKAPAQPSAPASQSPQGTSGAGQSGKQ